MLMPSLLPVSRCHVWHVIQATEDIGETVKEAAGGGDDIPQFDLPTGVAMGVCSFEVRLQCCLNTR